MATLQATVNPGCLGSGQLSASGYDMRLLASTLSALLTLSWQITPAAAAPDGYRVKQASAFGVRCDGNTDDTSALQTALDRLSSRDSLQLPAGTCITSTEIRLTGKQHVAILGAGKDRTIIKAIDPLHSAFIVSNGSAISLRSFQIYSPNSGVRSTDADSRGFYVENSDGITLDSVLVRHTAGAGILFYVVSNSKIVDSDVIENLADAFHITGASRNIVVRSSRAQGSGDDCFASIGYGKRLNHDIRFLDNACSDNRASGVSFEGTIGGSAYRNRLTRTGVAGIRIASQKSYNTGPVRNILLKDNILSQVKIRPEVDHAAIMIFSTLGTVRDVTLLRTTIANPIASIGTRIFARTPGTATVSDITVSGLRYTGANRMPRACFKISSDVARVKLRENSLNDAPCEAH